MPKKLKTKQPFVAKTMGSYQGQIARATGRKDERKAVEQASTITVLRPDESGNIVEVEVVQPIFANQLSPKKRRKPRAPRGSKSLL